VRIARIAGVAGPVAFVGAWAVSGAVTDGYSPARDAISDLAALGAPTRPWMTAGMVAFGVAMPVFARLLPRPAARAAIAAGVGTLAVAALPLDPGTEVPAHAVAAGASYLALAGVPAFAGNAPVALAALGLLGASVVVDGASGLLQRAGLTLVDVWIVQRALRPCPAPEGMPRQRRVDHVL